MIKVLKIIKESRERDLKRKRLLIVIGRTRLHIDRKEAVKLLLQLQRVIVS